MQNVAGSGRGRCRSLANKAGGEKAILAARGRFAKDRGQPHLAHRRYRLRGEGKGFRINGCADEIWPPKQEVGDLVFALLGFEGADAINEAPTRSHSPGRAIEKSCLHLGKG